MSRRAVWLAGPLGRLRASDPTIEPARPTLLRWTLPGTGRELHSAIASRGHVAPVLLQQDPPYDLSGMRPDGGWQVIYEIRPGGTPDSATIFAFPDVRLPWEVTS